MFFDKKVNPTRKAEDRISRGADCNDDAPIGNKISVLVASKDLSFTDTISQVLGTLGCAVSIVQNHKEVVSKFFCMGPAVVLLDYDSYGKKGTEIAKGMLSLRSNAKIIAMFSSDSQVNKDTEELGIELFLLKSDPLERLVRSVKAVADIKKPMSLFVRR